MPYRLDGYKAAVVGWERSIRRQKTPRRILVTLKARMETEDANQTLIAASYREARDKGDGKALTGGDCRKSSELAELDLSGVRGVTVGTKFWKAVAPWKAYWLPKSMMSGRWEKRLGRRVFFVEVK